MILTKGKEDGNKVRLYVLKLMYAMYNKIIKSYTLHVR